MKAIIKNTLILTAITLVSGLLLGLVYEITKAPIATAREAAKMEAYKEVMKEAELFKTIEIDDTITSDGTRVDEVVEAKSGDELKGYVITTTSSNGYGGDIQIAVGISADGTVKGIDILLISETAGLGMNALKPEFRNQFADKKVDSNGFVLTKNNAAAENEIDAISSATVTSNAVTDAVNLAVTYYYDVLGGSANE